MLRSIARDIQYQFQTGNSITRLIIANVSIFLAIILLQFFIMVGSGFSHEGGLFRDTVHYLFLSQDIMWDATHPWVVITHMFTHLGFFHILVNMLILYWLGRVAGDLLGDHRMFPLYIYSGLTSAIIYLISAPLFYEGSTLHGASGAVMGIVAAAGMTAPDYQMRLLLFGDVKLKYVVMGLLVMYFISLASLDNSGGQMAHFGGAAFGFFYVHMLRQGHDLTKGFRRLVSLLKKQPGKRPQPAKYKVPLEIKYRSSHRVQGSKRSSSVPQMNDQERLDYILDKINQTGYNSLDDEEKKFLDDASQK